jgi:hypothetical protein
MKAPSSAIWPLLHKCCTDRPSHTLEAPPTTSARTSSSAAPPQAVSNVSGDAVPRATGREPIPFRYARRVRTINPQAACYKPAATPLRAS